MTSELTSFDADDSTFVPDLLEKIDHPIDKMIADAAYDNFWVYEELKTRNIIPIIAPRAKHILSERYWEKPTYRDCILMDRCELGVQRWQQKSGYTKRSLVETAISCYKKVISSGLHSKKPANRVSEVKIACYVLNKMLKLGKPKAYKLKKSA